MSRLRKASGVTYATTLADPPSKANYLETLLWQMAYLNTRMNDMRRLLSKITEYYNTVFAQINSTLGDNANVLGSTSNLQQRILALNQSTAELKNYNDQKDFRKEIIAYTEQKNRYANMLLAFYAFLNISAVAAIFHLARNT